MLNLRIKKFLKVLNNVLLVIIAVIFLFSLSPLLPTQKVPKTYAVVSGSMEPTIKTGSLAITTYIRPEEVKVNDIVVFTSPSNNKDVILHRVIEKKSEEPLLFSTKGDANVGADSWDLMGVGILGKYNFSVPYVGYLTAFIRKPLGFVLMIGLPALYLIILQILSLRKAISEEIDKRVAEKLEKELKKTKTIIPFVTILFLGMYTIFIPGASAQFKNIVKITGLEFSTSSNLDLYPEEDCDKNDNDDNNGKEDDNTNRCKDKDKDEDKDKDKDKENDEDNSTPNAKLNSDLSQKNNSETTPSINEESVQDLKNSEEEPQTTQSVAE